MNIIQQSQAMFDLYQEKSGIDLRNIDQQSPEWFDLRSGVISASRAKDLIANYGKKDAGKMFETYLNQLVAELVSTERLNQISTAATKWGNDTEPKALSDYGFIYDAEVVKIPFVFADKSLRYGFSPDAYDATNNILLEVKCPFNSENHIATIRSNAIKPEYISQMQFQMYCAQAEILRYVSYDPRIPAKSLHTIDIKADHDMWEKFEKRKELMINSIDESLADFGMTFNDKYNRG